jgi:tellurite methyltransferase
MAHEDAVRWDARYIEEPRYSSFEKPRAFMLKHIQRLPSSGLALDVAMGLGGNAGLLIRHGLRVVGIDISGVALRRAKERLPELMAVQVDLTQFYLPSNTFDVILNFYYLNRRLWEPYKTALRPGGWLVFETLTLDMQERKPEVSPEYLLQPGELRLGFADLEILDYREGWREGSSGHPRSVASLLACKPT